METRTPAARLSASVAEWSKVLALAEKRRTDPGRFAEYAQILYARHPLPPALIADLLLRPTPYFQDAPDARRRAYLQELKEQGRVDTAAVLGALYKYSTAHARARPAALGGGGGDAPDKEQDGGPGEARKISRWKNSYEFEETLLMRLSKAVYQGSEIKTSENVRDVAGMLLKWMALYTDAAAALPRDMFGAIHGLQVKDETERSLNAFLHFLCAFSQDQVVLSRLSRPSFRGMRTSLGLQSADPQADGAPQASARPSQTAWSASCPWSCRCRRRRLRSWSRSAPRPSPSICRPRRRTRPCLR